MQSQVPDHMDCSTQLQPQQVHTYNDNKYAPTRHLSHQHNPQYSPDEATGHESGSHHLSSAAGFQHPSDVVCTCQTVVSTTATNYHQAPCGDIAHQQYMGSNQNINQPSYSSNYAMPIKAANGELHPNFHHHWYAENSNAAANFEYLGQDQADRLVELEPAAPQSRPETQNTLLASQPQRMMDSNPVIRPEEQQQQQQQQTVQPQWSLDSSRFKVYRDKMFHVSDDNPAIASDVSANSGRCENSSSPSIASTNTGREISNRTPPEKVIQRVKANKKERRRTQSINYAFNELRKHIPDVPSDTKLSKIKTLRLAISYISHLMSTLNEDNDDSRLIDRNGSSAGVGGGEGTGDSKVSASVQRQPHHHYWATFQLKPAAQTDDLQKTAASVALKVNLRDSIALANPTTEQSNHKQPSSGNSHMSQSGLNVGTSGCGRNKDRKHRTGWPEIIWKSSSSLRTIEALKHFEL